MIVVEAICQFPKQAGVLLLLCITKDVKAFIYIRVPTSLINLCNTLSWEVMQYMSLKMKNNS